MTSTVAGCAPTRSEHHERMRLIEDDHFGQCIWQQILEGRRIMVELMDYPAARTTALVVKHFETAIPKAGSMKPWPDQTATYVYLPVDDDNTWAGLDHALAAFEAEREADRKA